MEKQLTKATSRLLTAEEIAQVSGGGGKYELTTSQGKPRTAPNGVVVILTIIDD